MSALGSRVRTTFVTSFIPRFTFVLNFLLSCSTIFILIYTSYFLVKFYCLPLSRAFSFKLSTPHLYITGWGGPA